MLLDLMVRFSMTSGKVSSSAFSSSKVMAPLRSLSADSNSASVRSSSFSSGREMALSRRHDFRTMRSSSGSMEPLPESQAGQRNRPKHPHWHKCACVRVCVRACVRACVGADHPRHRPGTGT